MRLAIHRFLGWPTSPPRDHPPGVPVSRREQLYDLALYPAKHDKGTKYPCTEAQLRSLTHLNYEVDRPGDFDNAEKAARKLRDHLHLERRRTNGEKRALYTLKEGLELEDWGPDIALKAFHDLDLFFFFGALANNVKLRWVGKTEMKKINDTENPEGGIFVGLTVLKGSGKATIYLNRELFDVRAKVEDAMWSTLLHEMLHAYFAVMTNDVLPTTDYTKQRGWTAGHGPLFRECLQAIHRYARQHTPIEVLTPESEYWDL